MRHTPSRHHPRMRVIQYPRDVSERTEKPRRTGYPACAGYDGVVCGASRSQMTARSIDGPPPRPPRKIVSDITINYSAKPHLKPPVAQANDDENLRSTDPSLFQSPAEVRRSSQSSGDCPCRSVLPISPPQPSARWRLPPPSLRPSARRKRP